jgi:hypothetical protein
MRRTPLKRAPMKKRYAPLRKGRRKTVGTAEQKLAFRVAVCSEGRCAVESEACYGRLEAHHVTSQQHIRRFATTNKLTEEETAELIWEPRNGISLCANHHERHTLALEPVPRSVLPEDALVFADSLGLSYLLDKLYPGSVAA